MRRERHPHLLLSRIVVGMDSKPRGYAGDFLTIEWLHGNEPAEDGVAGKPIDLAFLDHVVDWRLIQRDEEDRHRLFEASAFGGRCSEIRFEPERVNLLAMGVKG